MDPEIVDHPTRHRFELAIDGSDEPAVAYYRIEGDRVVLTHTEVPETLSGRGVGSRLAKGVFEQIRASGRKAVLRCPFMDAFVTRHPEYADLVVAEDSIDD